MSADAEMQRHQITFGQAEGREPLPAQLKLGEISPELTAYLWRVIHESLAASTNHSSMGGEPWLAEDWKKILYDWHTIREHKFADEFNNNARTLIGRVKIIVTSGDYLKVLNFVEFVARHRYCPRRLLGEMVAALELIRSAYRLIDKSIIPIVSEEESRAIVLAFANVQDEKYRGARQHLREAGSSLSLGSGPIDWLTAM